MVVTFAYDTIFMNYYTTYKRIGPGKTQTLSRQLKTTPHVYFILLRQQTLPLLLFLIMLQNHATLQEIRQHLQQELQKIYPAGETHALIRLIMEHCGYPSPQSLLNPGQKPGASTIAQINEIVRDIHTHRPIQYILGHTRFYELNILLDEHALIPRPETEEMIHKIISSTGKKPTRIIDLGCGSGCIALALKKHYPLARVTGLDLSTGALDLARRNGKQNQLEVEWVRGDILGDIPGDVRGDVPGGGPDSGPGGKFDLIVSNPPYVLNREKSQMERNVLDFEPHEALFVEDSDPLIFYRALASISKILLSPGGAVWLEINEKFGSEVAGLMSGSGFTQTLIHKDIHEKERFVQARF